VQGYTHFLAGAAIEHGLREKVKNKQARFALLAGLGIATHIVLDDIARLTYHPPNAMPGDPFWLSYHVFVAIASLTVFVAYRRYYVGMLCSVIPDFDWIIRPIANALGWTWWREGSLHGLFRSLPGLGAVGRHLTKDFNWTHLPTAALVEIAIATVLFAVLVWLDYKHSPPPKAEKPLAENGEPVHPV